MIACPSIVPEPRNPGHPLVEHFSPAEFLIVIERCESLGIRVIGIEVFSTVVEPSFRAALEDIEISPVPGYVLAAPIGPPVHTGRSDITISATFDVPDALLNSENKTGRQTLP
jgi:hypothetical protein